MNRTEMIDAIAEKTGASKAQTASIINAFQSVITEALAGGDSVAMVGFGTFEVRERSARTGRNPRTGEPIDIAASKAPAFKAGKALKEAVN